MQELFIKQNIDTHSYRKKFLEDGYVTISNFLKHEKVELLHSFFVEMPEDWWFSSSYISDCETLQESCRFYITRNSHFNAEKISEEKRIAYDSYIKKQLSHYFLQTTGYDHYIKCGCIECNFRKQLNEEYFLSFVKNITGISCTQYERLYARKMAEDCFVSLRKSDWINSIGFTIELTKNWRPEWGGLLYFVNEDNSIEKTISPEYNSITFYNYDLIKSKHFISQVSTGVKQHRVTYIGAFLQDPLI